MTEYWGASQIAGRLGVATGTVTKWVERFAATDHPFPEPDVEIVETGGRITRGWAPHRWPEIKKWADKDRRYAARIPETGPKHVRTSYSERLRPNGMPLFPEN
ncbi:hypothetical protein [Amycolatopsis regifaucium]|uniref:Uncharacterized protein n=1 Tax=Amycolatopsis regifaucium TaxID=546365 RepID=A0A154M553_9PSEU|nr:hypothetical protein [Amycolatopsis regifaucium]KZB79633.1 hypothetical protein AVL48_14550 [Amycolatopsis regifaucium]SFI63355.1 hypothetical protein SAMN04489731_11212 [Amycolatopsis regifaucium]